MSFSLSKSSDGIIKMINKRFPRNWDSWLVFLFLGHACSSVTLILLNKNISIHFPHAWTVVFCQNFGTILGALFLHIIGIRPIRLPKREHMWRIILNSLWLIFVLWASVKSLQLVSVPLYVVARNTVPFQTALLDWLFLSKKVTVKTILGLLLTFIGTLIYTFTDMSLEAEGVMYAFLNTILVASICVYENSTMHLVKQHLSPIELNFYRVLFSSPFLIPFLYVEWTSDFNSLDHALSLLQPLAIQITLSALLAFSIGSFLLSLQGQTTATTIQLANIGYKFLTTVLSRFTHPTEVTPMGWMGYFICTAGLVQYSYNPVEIEKKSKKDGSSSSRSPSRSRGGTSSPMKSSKTSPGKSESNAVKRKSTTPKGGRQKSRGRTPSQSPKKKTMAMKSKRT